MLLKNPHTGEPVQIPKHEPRGSRQPQAALPSPEELAADRAEKARQELAQRQHDAHAMGLSLEALERCLLEGVSLVFVRKLLQQREAARSTLAGIDHVLAMLGIATE